MQNLESQLLKRIHYTHKQILRDLTCDKLEEILKIASFKLQK